MLLQAHPPHPGERGRKKGEGEEERGRKKGEGEGERGRKKGEGEEEGREEEGKGGRQGHHNLHHTWPSLFGHRASFGLRPKMVGNPPIEYRELHLEKISGGGGGGIDTAFLNSLCSSEPLTACPHIHRLPIRFSLEDFWR